MALLPGLPDGVVLVRELHRCQDCISRNTGHDRDVSADHGGRGADDPCLLEPDAPNPCGLDAAAVRAGVRAGPDWHYGEPVFLDAIGHLRAPRRRDGATFWRVYRDLGDSSRFVERFIVTSWADYLHQRARATVADHDLEAHVRAFQLEGVPVTMQHYLAER